MSVKSWYTQTVHDTKWVLKKTHWTQIRSSALKAHHIPNDLSEVPLGRSPVCKLTSNFPLRPSQVRTRKCKTQSGKCEIEMYKTMSQSQGAKGAKIRPRFYTCILCPKAYFKTMCAHPSCRSCGPTFYLAPQACKIRSKASFAVVGVSGRASSCRSASPWREEGRLPPDHEESRTR